MKVILGHAVCSESGGKYGTPGDQTGKELRLQNWYISGDGWKAVFRWKDKELAKRAAKYVKECCESVHVGYSQSLDETGRESLDRIAAKYKYDIDKLIEFVNCDCSTLMASAVRSVDGNVNRGMSTGTEEAELSKSKLFTELKDSKYLTKPDDLEVGDILWRVGHTAMVVSIKKDKEEKELSTVKETVVKKVDPFEEKCLAAKNMIGDFDKQVKKELGVDGVIDSIAANELLMFIIDKLKTKHNVVKEVSCSPYLVKMRSPFKVFKSLSGDDIVASGVSTGIYTIVAESSDDLRGKLKSGAGWIKLSEAQKL